MPKTPQSYANHTRYSVLYHYIASPIVSLYAIHAIRRAVQSPDRTSIYHAIFSFGIAAGIFAARTMALTVQNRVIRLEMRLRLKEVIPASLAARVNELTVRQLIALRFASDAELPALVERVLKGELAGSKAIKQAVRDWQADYLRC